MKNLFYFTKRVMLTGLLGLSCQAAWADTNTVTRTAPTPKDAASIYVIPITQPIMHPQLYIVRRGVQEAIEQKADAIVFTMDTPGGRLDICNEIINNIIDIDIPTFTLVEHWALSAGAMIALATDQIYMEPGSLIGASMPVIMAPGGGGYQDQGEDQQEKMNSPTAAMIRSVAQRKGRNEELAEAMVRRQNELIIDGVEISKEGELLTLTNEEANKAYGEDQRPLLSEGTVDDLDDMLATAGFTNPVITHQEITWADELARLIQIISPLLLTLAGLAIYIEFNTPGIGWAAGIAAICAIVFFFGHNVAGLAGQEEMLLFMLGTLLVLLEIFVIPGFGIAGISGMALILAALFFAMVQQYPGFETDGLIPSLPSLSDTRRPLLVLCGSIITSGLGAILLTRFLPESNIVKSRIVLNESTSTDAGYQSSAEHTRELIGQIGTAQSDLRPAGTAIFDVKPVDVVTPGGFIAKGASIKVIEVHGHRVVVEAVQTES